MKISGTKEEQKEQIRKKIIGTLLYYSFAEDWDNNGYVPNHEVLHVNEVPESIDILKEQISSLSRSERTDQINYAMESLMIDLVLLTSAEKYGGLICAVTDKKERN